MKAKTVLLLLLFLPYLIWLITIPAMGMPFDSVVNTFLAGFSFVYAFGIIFWGIPYTTFVIGMLIWSINKSAKEIYSALSQSPLSLALITLTESVILFFVLLFSGLISGERSPILDVIGGLFNIIIYALIAMIGIFIYGYAFVFLGRAVYRTFERLKWIKDEEAVS
jgi:hypothetical protein